MKAREFRNRPPRRPARCRGITNRVLVRLCRASAIGVLGVVPRAWPVEAANDPVA